MQLHQKHCYCNHTTRDHSYNWCIHGEECINITTPPPLVPLSIVRMKFDSPQIFLDCIGDQQDYKPGKCPTFGGTFPLFELAKVKKKRGTVPLLWNFSDGKFYSMKKQRMMSFLHGIFTSAFSLVYCHDCDKFSYEKPSLNPKSPEPQLCGLFWFLVMYMHNFGSMSQFFTLVVWQVSINVVSNLWQ